MEFNFTNFLLFGWPTVLIIAWVSYDIYKLRLQSKERMAQMSMSQSNNSHEDLIRIIDELKKEVAQLRDTTTQYDISIDKTLHNIEQRLSYLEQKSVTQSTSQYEQQRIG